MIIDFKCSQPISFFIYLTTNSELKSIQIQETI
jgi:hypothetical protein